MAQQTAVEWFLANLPDRFKNALITACEEEIKQAKQMEKEQLDKAYYQGQESKYIGGPSYNELHKNE